MVRSPAAIKKRELQFYTEMVGSANLDEEPSTLAITSEMLEFHEIEEFNRGRIIDWIISVLRAFKVSSHQTFFLTISILDRYLIAKFKQGIIIGTDNLYLLGLTAILISSKFEDVETIRIKTLAERAGHGRFKIGDIVARE